MRPKAVKICLVYVFVLLCMIQCEKAAGYRSEIEITPAPPEEVTTKKSGFFSGFKNFFRGSPTTTTTTPVSFVEPTTARNVPQQNLQHGSGGPGAQKPPALLIPQAPLMPLGPRPDTPPSSPLSGNQHQPPQWPQPQTPTQATATATSTTTTTATAQHGPPSPQLPKQQQHGGQPGGNFGSFGSGIGRPTSGGTTNTPYGFGAYQPPKSQPSGFDLSYGGGFGGRPQTNGRPGSSLAPLTTSTSTTTTTTPRSSLPQQPTNVGFDLRGDFGKTGTSTTRRPQSPIEDFPSLPAPRRPSTGVKEDFPALPVPKSPTPPPSPSSSAASSSPSAWKSPLPTPSSPIRPNSGATTPHSPGTTTNGVSFVPHVPLHTRTTTTVRPGFENTGNSLATDDELINLTENLYTKETNSQLDLIRINVQGKTRSIDSADEAPLPLLDVDVKAYDLPTISKMRLLLNNYEIDATVNEYVTPNERKEENDFLDAVMSTNVMRQAMLFLQNKGIVTPDPKTHRDLVKELWFTQYSRGGGKIGSSGFEHVFVSEVKNGTILGFHNWVYFSEEEKAGRLDYKGYMKQLDVGNKAKILKLRFSHDGVNKPVNTLSIGTTPELELALYTVCFMMRPDRTCPVSLGNQRFGIITYSWRYRGKSLIGSAYMEI